MFTSDELMDQAQAIAMEAVAAITADRVLQAGQEAFFGAIGNRRVVRVCWLEVSGVSAR